MYVGQTFKQNNLINHLLLYLQSLATICIAPKCLKDSTLQKEGQEFWCKGQHDQQNLQQNLRGSIGGSFCWYQILKHIEGY